MATPLFWSTGDDIGPVSITSLVVDGTNVILNDIIQSGFSGSITTNASNGVDIYIYADTRCFGPGAVLWTLTFTDGVFSTVETGYFEVSPVTTVYETGTGSSVMTPAVIEEDYYREYPHPITKKMIEGWEWDNTAWPDEELRNNFIFPALYDATSSGIAETYWQAGIAGGDDLRLTNIEECIVSGVSTSSQSRNVREWMPIIEHGHFFIGPSRYYLFSDDSIFRSLVYDNFVPGVNWGTHSGVNILRLVETPKTGIPIVARQYEWDEEENRYEVAVDVRHCVYFTGSRDSDDVRQSTYDSDKDAILFENIDTDFDEFVVAPSGLPTARNLIFNKQYSSLVGEGAVGDGEFLGYSDGTDEQIYHTQFSPIDSGMPMRVTAYLGDAVSGVNFTAVRGQDVVLEGYQAGVDYDLGLVKFSTISGIVPEAGFSVEASYFKTVGVEYEPENATKEVECLNGDANPIRRYADGGFLYISDRDREPASIILTAELAELSTYSYGPLYIGNNLARLVATVYDRNGNTIEGVEVEFEIVSTPACGSLGTSLDDSATAITNWEGQAKVYYRSPSQIEDIGEYITTVGAIDNSPSYAGVTQTTTYTTASLAIAGGANEVLLFNVYTDDPVVGYRSSLVADDDISGQLEQYYLEYFQDEEIYGPTGLTIAGTLEALAAEWESVHRTVWNLLAPLIFTGSSGGRKVLAVVESSTDIDPHMYESPAVVPFQPIDIIHVSEGVNGLVFDTSTYSLPNPGTGDLESYFVVAPSTVTLQAKTYVARTKQYITSNEAYIKIDIPSHMTGLWEVEDLGSLTLQEISSILASKDINSLLGKRVPLGFRLRSNNVTLAGAIGGVTFLDINSRKSWWTWPSLDLSITIV